MIRYLRVISLWSILFIIPNVCMSADKEDNPWYSKFFKKKSSETVISSIPRIEEKQQIQWEYSCEWLIDEIFLKKLKNEKISEYDISDELDKAISLSNQEKFLNKKGREGWELVSVEFIQVSTLFVLTEKFPLYFPVGYFKRSKK